MRNQAYQDWELCIVDDASPDANVASMIAGAAGQDSRITTLRLPQNVGIATATNTALAMSTGAFIALFDHDDELPPHALARVATEIVAEPETDVLFSDEDQILGGRRCRPYFKPGWNPDLMLSQNLLPHGIYRRELIERIGGMRPDFPGSQDYDLALRATSAVPASRIKHIPQVLYHWRQHEGSFSAQRAAQCQQAARAALAEHLGGQATVAPNPDMPQWTRIAFHIADPPPPVSLILLEGAGVPGKTGYENVEICRSGEAAATGEVLVFLAPDMEPARDGWLRELVSHALRREIGCAGPRLDGPDGRIADSGLLLHPEEIAQTLAPPSDPGDPGYLGHFVLCRNVSAVSMPGLAVRRAVFEALGGFDARAGTFADVDFCLRNAELGLRCLWTPHARLRYRVPPPARDDADGARFMRERWCKSLARDPYANPNLVIRAQNLHLAEKNKDVLF